MGTQRPHSVSRLNAFASWLVVLVLVVVPIVVAVRSPLLATRDPIYIVGGMAGVIGMALLLLQPVLIGALLPGIHVLQARRAHQWLGFGLLSMVALHVVGLWIFSPPDVVDALLLRSPTPFSLWGVIAMWAVFLSSALAIARRRLKLPMKFWTIAHTLLALLIVISTAVHAWLIEGAMGLLTKAVLCLAVIVATVWVTYLSIARLQRTIRR